MVFTQDWFAVSGFQVAYPDTGESGDTYDIDVQTEPATRKWLEPQVPSHSVSILTLDTAESGDTYDAEVDHFSGELFKAAAQLFKNTSIERRYVSYGFLFAFLIGY